MTAAPETSFQVSDLQRNAREVLDAARTSEGALIRDKDGVNLKVMLASRASRESYVLEGLSDVLRLFRLIDLPAEIRDPFLYGDLIWVSNLQIDAQREFAWNYARTLQAVPANGTEQVEELLYDWQQTARIHADADLHSELVGDLDEPLFDVEL